jgi:hypothetical protein
MSLGLSAEAVSLALKSQSAILQPGFGGTRWFWFDYPRDQTTDSSSSRLNLPFNIDFFGR